MAGLLRLGAALGSLWQGNDCWSFGCSRPFLDHVLPRHVCRAAYIAGFCEFSLYDAGCCIGCG